MSNRRTCALGLGLFLLCACGAKTMDFTSPDAAVDGGAGKGGGWTTGSGGSAPTGGRGGSAGNGGSTGADGSAGAGSGAGGAGTGGSGAGAGGGAGSTGGNAGSGGVAGAGGSVDAGPPAFVTSSFQGFKATQVDLLFVIDNSSSMTDKQSVLSNALPEFVDQLVNPSCISVVTTFPEGQAVDGVCPQGTRIAFPPVKDIHVGVISSSLGNHGAAGVCEDAIDGRSDPHNNDQAHLLTRSEPTNAPTYQNKGFLYYNPTVADAISIPGQLAKTSFSLVRGVGQHGCGYEAPLEAAYRFLVDPDPYATIRIDTSIGGFGKAVLNGTDQTVLQQRADFLRAGSLVNVVMLTDENDCSIVDGEQGFYPLLPPVMGTGRNVLKGGTTACKTNPNDICCFNCGQSTPPAGCAPADQDPACQMGELTIAEDPPNLRCFDQKRRYGVDFLYPVQRYIDGFTNVTTRNRQNNLVDNPLFVRPCTTAGTECGTRDPRAFLLTGIVGVPRQRIANSNLPTFGYKTAKQLASEGIWADIVGDPLNPAGPVAPRDPHMIESIQPRAGLPVPGSAATADPVHGHEWDPSKEVEGLSNSELQYACTFPLATPRVCSGSEDCDCFGSSLASTMKPICQNANGMYTTTQVGAKAYPATRILQVLQGLGDQAVTTSICAAQTTDANRADYGYYPNVRATVDRMAKPLAQQCLALSLPYDTATQQTPCTVIEVFDTNNCQCDSDPGRRTAREELLTDEMRAKGSCRCEIQQLTGANGVACRTEADVRPGGSEGWCYIDPGQQSVGCTLGPCAGCDIVRDCAWDEKRLVRFVSVSSAPRPGSTAFLRCTEAPTTPVPTGCHSND